MPEPEQAPPGILATLQKLEADVIELRATIATQAPVVQAVAATLGKVQPAVAEILAIAKAFKLT
jgi:hypothetical protein